jgi:hypothetical protein
MEGMTEALWYIQLQRLLSTPPPSLEQEIPALRELAAALPNTYRASRNERQPPSAPSLQDFSPEKEFSNVFTPTAPHLSTEDMECAICMDAQV